MVCFPKVLQVLFSEKFGYSEDCSGKETEKEKVFRSTFLGGLVILFESVKNARMLEPTQ